MIRFAQLMDAYCCRDVGEIVFKSRGDDFVIPRTIRGETFPRVVGNPMQRHDTHARGQLVVVSAGHTAFARRNALVGIKRETTHSRFSSNRIPWFANVITVKRRATMSRIFDHSEAKFLSQRTHSAHIGNPAAIVHRDDGAQSFAPCYCRGTHGAGMVTIEVQILLTAIHQQRLGVEISDHLCCSGESHSRHKDRLPSLQADAFQCQMQSSRCAIDRDGMPHTHVSSEFRFKLFGFWPCRQPTRAQRIDHFVDLIVSDYRPKERYLHMACRRIRAAYYSRVRTSTIYRFISLPSEVAYLACNFHPCFS